MVDPLRSIFTRAQCAKMLDRSTKERCLCGQALLTVVTRSATQWIKGGFRNDAAQQSDDPVTSVKGR